MRNLTTILLGLILIPLYSCGQSNSFKSNSNTEKDVKALTIDAFSDFPSEISGCSCYFSNDSTEFKNGMYIYMNDFGQYSFLKINGVLTKFTQTEFNDLDSKTITKAKSDNYEITVEINTGIENGYETSIHTGTIKITDRKGKTLIKTFYGLCGC